VITLRFLHGGGVLETVCGDGAVVMVGCGNQNSRIFGSGSNFVKKGF
jgi:hypothetical protein